MKHGGARTGAGRPKGSGKKKPSKVMRIPGDKIQKVQAVLSGDSATYPLFSSRVSAGFPSPADDHQENQLNLNEHIVKNPSSTFFVEVSGESMTGAGIYPKDILVVDKSLSPQHMKVAIIFLNGEFTVKRLSYKNGALNQLLAENPSYPDITITPDDQLEIWGMVSYVIHQC